MVCWAFSFLLSIFLLKVLFLGLVLWSSSELPTCAKHFKHLSYFRIRPASYSVLARLATLLGEEENSQAAFDTDASSRAWHAIAAVRGMDRLNLGARLERPSATYSA